MDSEKIDIPFNTNRNPRRILKNTIILFIRMFVTLVISLYTSRIVLKELGITDYGIYNVVGGLITIFSFINNSMAQASQRFISFELGHGSKNRLRSIFSTCTYIHFFLAIVIVILGETIGLWYIYNIAVIPEDRFTAALWIYQCSIIVSFCTILTVPYNALIIAHEKMSAFAYFTIFESVAKLGIAWSLLLVRFDKLILYGVLMASLSVIIRFLYSSYSSRHFSECKLEHNINFKMIREMSGFAGWSLCGSIAAAGYSQGLNLLLNAFFNPAINAARGIAITVQAVIRNFSGNFQMAVNPQITKSYAAGDLNYLYSLINRSSQLTYYLYFLIAMPVFLEVDTLLSIWLVDVPDYSAIFIRILLIISSIEILSTPLNVSVQATGKIRFYELLTSIIMILIVPLSWIGLKIWRLPEIVFVVFLFQTIIAYIVRLFLAKKIIGLSIRDYIFSTLFKITAVTIIATIIPTLVHFTINGNTLKLITVFSTSMAVTPTVVYYVGLSKIEKELVIGKIKNILHKWGK